MGAQTQSIHRQLDDMDQYKTCQGLDYSIFKGEWIDPPSKAEPDPKNHHYIDSNMKYPVEFKEFMDDLDGSWDLYGPFSIAHEVFTGRTYEQICDIFRRRQDIIIKKKKAAMEKLRIKWEQEL